MDDEAHAAEAALPFKPSHEVVGDGDALEGASQHELSRMQREPPAGLDLDQLGQARLLGGEIDVRVLVAREDPERAAQP